ncbi:MAG: dihydrofolate reductase family protein [Alphaproteobacteria bacterium]
MEHEMQPIIYDVAVSLDGFISGPSGDISLFSHDGPVVDDYNQRLTTYSTAIMGRATYEFGYGFGLKPGQNPYSHMETLIFSDQLEIPHASDVRLIRKADKFDLYELKKSAAGPIYLCGGGDFAGSLLNDGLIDLVRVKRAPIVLRQGVSLFGNHEGSQNLERLNTKYYENGYLLEEFRPQPLK